MPISGLLLTLGGTAGQREEALAAIRADSAFKAGEQFGRWLPVAAEAADDEQCRQQHDWLMSLPAVLYVDVVSVDFENDAAAATIQPDETPALS